MKYTLQKRKNHTQKPNSIGQTAAEQTDGQRGECEQKESENVATEVLQVLQSCCRRSTKTQTSPTSSVCLLTCRAAITTHSGHTVSHMLQLQPCDRDLITSLQLISSTTGDLQTAAEVKPPKPHIDVRVTFTM